MYGVTCVSLFELITACLTADGRLKIGCGLAFNCKTAKIEAVVSDSEASSSDDNNNNARTSNSNDAVHNAPQQATLRTKAVQRFNVGWDPAIQQARGGLRAPTGTELERHAQVHGVGALFVAGNRETGPQRMSEYLEDLHENHNLTRVPFEAALERDFASDVTELVVSTFEEDTWWLKRFDELLGLRVILVLCFLLVLVLGARIFCITEVLLEVNNFLVIEVKVALLNALEERALQERKKSEAVKRLRENKRAIRKQERVLALARQRLIAHEAAAMAELCGVEERSDSGSDDNISNRSTRITTPRVVAASAEEDELASTQEDELASEEDGLASTNSYNPSSTATRLSTSSSDTSDDTNNTIVSDATTERLLVELGLTTFSSSESSSEEEEESDDGGSTRFYRMQLRAEVGCYASLLSSVVEKGDSGSMHSSARKFLLNPPQRKLTCGWIVRLGAFVLCKSKECSEHGRDPNLRLQSDGNENDNDAQVQYAREEDDPELAAMVPDEEDLPTQVVKRTPPNAARRLKVVFRDAFHNRARMRADETLARMWGMLILHWNEVSRFLSFA